MTFRDNVGDWAERHGVPGEGGALPSADEEAGPWRGVAAIGGCLLLVLNGGITWLRARGVDDVVNPLNGQVIGQNVNQVIQIYTEGLFGAVLVIGLAVCIYIGTRAGE